MTEARRDFIPRRLGHPTELSLMKHAIRCLGVGVVIAAGLLVWAADPPAQPDLSEFKTVENAVTTRISRTVTPARSAQPAYLGIQLKGDARDKMILALVEQDSPAAKAGLKVGDVVTEVAGQKPANAAALRELLLSKAPGDKLPVTVQREDKPVAVEITLDSHSHPLTATARAVMGVQMAEDNGTVRIDVLTPNLPAAQAGLKAGDVIVKVDGQEVRSTNNVRDAIGKKSPGDTIEVVYKRDDKEETVKVKLAADGSAAGGGPRPWDDRRQGLFAKEVYKLAVVTIEYPDVKHNEKITPKDWERALFSTKEYSDKSVTGQTVYGSLNDYYQEISCGAFRVEGKVFDYVEVSKKRTDYSTDSNRYKMFEEALDKLLEREKDALKGFDGIFFLHAGRRVETQRGGLFWPHKSNFSYKGQRFNYFICPECGGGQRGGQGASNMASISVISHEFGHMLGLPDLYAQQDSPTSEGLGVWCTMSTGHGESGKPLHFSAWCKEQLGWLKPAVVDPTTQQKLILAPITGSTKECYKVLLQPDGSEYLLLENRVKKGFDVELPGEGLLIWRVVDGKPILEESHGVLGPRGPGSFPSSVPFPSKANTAFTPYTQPSSKPLKNGGLPVHITNIRKLDDGRITFFIGYESL
jgi:M6 family metalloprotease-like protein